MIRLVRLLPILEVGNDEKGVGVFLPKHMRCASNTLNLVATTDAGKTLNKCAIYKGIIVRRLQMPKRYGLSSPGAARRRMS